MSKVAVQAQKEWYEFRRDRLSLALAFLLPIFSLLLFGYGIRLESKNLPTVVQDLDATSISSEYVQRLFATNILVPARGNPTGSPLKALDEGRAKVAVIIPHGFANRLLARQLSPVQIFIDGTDISNAQIIFDTMKATNAYFLKALQPLQNVGATIEPQVRIWFNPGREESLFIVPGVFGIVLWMYPALLAAVAASREKEQGTIVRVYSSRMSALQWLLGKAALYFIIGILLSVLIVALGCLLFHIYFLGDPTPFLVSTPIYILSSVMFGLLLGITASNQTTAVQATSTAAFFPCLLLSGFVYPVSNIPFPLSLFSLIVPTRYFIDVCRDAFAKGVGWQAVWQEPLILMLFACVFLFLSWINLRRMQFKE